MGRVRRNYSEAQRLKPIGALEAIRIHRHTQVSPKSISQSGHCLSASRQMSAQPRLRNAYFG